MPKFSAQVSVHHIDIEKLKGSLNNTEIQLSSKFNQLSTETILHS